MRIKGALCPSMVRIGFPQIVRMRIKGALCPSMVNEYILRMRVKGALCPSMVNEYILRMRMKGALCPSMANIFVPSNSQNAGKRCNPQLHSEYIYFQNVG